MAICGNYIEYWCLMMHGVFIWIIFQLEKSDARPQATNSNMETSEQNHPASAMRLWPMGNPIGFPYAKTTSMVGATMALRWIPCVSIVAVGTSKVVTTFLTLRNVDRWRVQTLLWKSLFAVHHSATEAFECASICLGAPRYVDRSQCLCVP